MTKNKLLRMICTILFVLQFCAEVVAAVMIWRLDMLPAKFAVPLYAAFGLIAAISAVLLLLPVKGRGGRVRRVIGCVLAILVIAGCILISVVVGDLHSTIREVTTPESTETTRNLYVQQEDPAQSLQDVSDYLFAVIESYDVENTQAAIRYIEQELGAEIVVVEYPTVQEAVNALLSGEAGCLILNKGYIPILEEDERYADFEQRVRVLAELPIILDMPTTEPLETTQPVETTEPPKPLEITEKPFIMYISGSDTRSSYLDVSRSDVNILAVVNPVTKQVLLLNTPRDYFIPNPAGGGALDKLTHCGIYGIDCSIEALSQLYGAEIDYYAQVNFTGFETMVDAVGGVTVYSDVSFSAGGHYFQKGENYLDGESALCFARERYSLAGGDNARGRNQMKIIQAVINKLTTGTTVITNYASILESMEGMFVTSLQMEDISKLVKMQLSDMASWNIQSYAVTGTGDSQKNYSMPGLYTYVMWPNEEKVAYASELIQKVIDGSILTPEDVK